MARDAAGGEFSSATKTGVITNRHLAELSGIVASQANPGVLWVHNDLARDQVHAVGTNGQLLSSWSLSNVVSDLEDISIGPGPLRQVQYLYIGDIGDNPSVRPFIRVYRVPEPAVYLPGSVTLNAAVLTRKFPAVEQLILQYPDGPHNAEEIMIDPLRGELLIVTKENTRARFYVASREQLNQGGNILLAFAGEIAFPIVSAGDIRFDGLEIILRQEDFARVWRRNPNESMAQTMKRAPGEAPVVGTPTEPNGEGITFARDGAGYFTVSEGNNPPLYYFARTNGPSPLAPRLLLSSEALWHFADDGNAPDVNWKLAGFDDSSWKLGPGQFGYGEGDEQTILEFGAVNAKRITTFFRTALMLTEVPTNATLRLSLVFDDGIVVYINGLEVLRRNLAIGASAQDLAFARADELENIWQHFIIPNELKKGTNLIAVEVHRADRTEEDLSFDLRLWVDETSGFKRAVQKVSEREWLAELYVPPRERAFLEESSNLLDWRSLTNLIFDAGRNSFRISNEGAARFYRLRQTAP